MGKLAGLPLANLQNMVVLSGLPSSQIHGYIMDFSLTAEQKMLQDTARRFAADELPAHAKAIEENDTPPTLALRKRFAEMGFMGINLPTEYGGAGLGHFEAVLILEELAKISVAVAFPVFEAALVQLWPLRILHPRRFASASFPKSVQVKWLLPCQCRNRRLAPR